MVSPEQLKELKNESKSLKASILIGKSGFTENIFTQIKLYIKANKFCKVKISKNFLDSQEVSKKELAQILAKETNSDLIDQIGNVVVLWKR